MEFLGMPEVALKTYFVCDLFCFFSDGSLAMVLGAVYCPAEVRCTTVSALRNDKFSLRLGGYSPPYPLQVSSLHPLTYFNHPISKIRMGCNCSISLKMARKSQLLYAVRPDHITDWFKLVAMRYEVNKRRSSRRSIRSGRLSVWEK